MKLGIIAKSISITRIARIIEIIRSVFFVLLFMFADFKPKITICDHMANQERSSNLAVSNGSVRSQYRASQRTSS